MQDPLQGIAPELQPHIHLLSTYRFPQFASLPPEKFAEWLMGAPKITRDQAPFYWQYLDRPVDGTIILTWQSHSLRAEFPSDGYIWAQPEARFELEVPGGYTLQMFHAKVGYAPGEPVATHCRRRYRLLPSKFPNPTSANPDPTLWITHYSRVQHNEEVPSHLIPVDMHMQNSLQTRAYLHGQGQIVQKEFMLHDRSNWPQIAFPRGQPRGPALFGGNAPPARIPQSMAYPPQPPTAGPPAKRVRTQANANQAAAGSAAAVLEVEDEEDTSRGDLFDHTSPREISMSRYKQNHEWMEEVLNSPWAMSQIIPADLGLGLRGELASLTEGIFDAPVDPEKDISKNAYVGRLDPDKADEFRKRANERITQTNNEIEKMKAKHAKRLAKFQKNSLITTAEKEMRTAVDNPSDVGSELWRLEGKHDEEDGDEERPTSNTGAPSKVSDILAKVEASLGRHVNVMQELIRIQDGGYEEPPAIPSPQPLAVPSPRASPPVSHNGSTNSGVLIGDADIDMGGSAAGLLDQFHTGLSSNAGSGFPTPQPLLQGNSAAGTPSNIPTQSPQPLAHTPGQQPAQPDVNMTDATISSEPGQDATGTGDWVVVPPGGVSPTLTSAQPSATVISQSLETITPTASTPLVPLNTNPSPLPESSNQTPLPDFHASPNDFADLGDLNTAGDALASYGEDLEESGADLGDLGMDLDVGMDDSAFGEAFHGVEPRVEGDGDGDGDGL